MSEEVHERFSSPVHFLFLSSPLPLSPMFGCFHWFWLFGGSAGVVWLFLPFCAFSQLVLASHHPSHCWCPLERCSGRGGRALLWCCAFCHRHFSVPSLLVTKAPRVRTEETWISEYSIERSTVVIFDITRAIWNLSIPVQSDDYVHFIGDSSAVI